MADDCVFQLLHSELVNYILEQKENKDAKVPNLWGYKQLV